MDRGRGRMHCFILFRLGIIRFPQRRIIVGAFAQSGKVPISFVISAFRLSACISAGPTGWISAKFDMGDFYENISTNSTFG